MILIFLALGVYMGWKRASVRSLAFAASAAIAWGFASELMRIRPMSQWLSIDAHAALIVAFHVLQAGLIDLLISYALGRGLRRWLKP